MLELGILSILRELYINILILLREIANFSFNDLLSEVTIKLILFTLNLSILSKQRLYLSLNHCSNMTLIIVFYSEYLSYL